MVCRPLECVCLLGTDWYMCGNRLVLILGGYSVVWWRGCVMCGEWKPLIEYELCVHVCVCMYWNRVNLFIR